MDIAIIIVILITVLYISYLRYRIWLLSEYKDRYNSILEKNLDGVFVLNGVGELIQINQKLEELSGYKKEDLLNQSFQPYVHPDDLDIAVSSYISAMNGEPLTVEIRIFHKNGSTIPVQIKDIPYKRKNKIIGVIAIVKDLTEERRTEEYLRNVEKLSVAGELAAGIAHEIKNPLTSLRGFTQFIYQDSNERSKEYLDIMINEIDRINFIVSELMMLAKPHSIQMKNNDIHKVLNDVVKLINAEAMLKNIEIVEDFTEGSIFVNCEENQLKQVFLNLLKNAIEAMDRGKITITSVIVDGTVIILIKDEGTGISEEQLCNVGKPFYTTKHSGTGLGLTICERILHHHLGTISFESKQNEGTTVHVTLPTVLQHHHESIS